MARYRYPEKAPCMGCTDRYVGCHGSCERYKAYSQKRLEFFESFSEKFRDDGIYASYRTEVLRRSKAKRAKGR